MPATCWTSMSGWPWPRRHTPVMPPRATTYSMLRHRDFEHLAHCAVLRLTPPAR